MTLVQFAEAPLEAHVIRRVRRDVPREALVCCERLIDRRISFVLHLLRDDVEVSPRCFPLFDYQRHQVVESAVDLLKLLVKLLKPLVNLLKAIINLLEAMIDLLEARINGSRYVIQLLVDPGNVRFQVLRLSHVRLPLQLTIVAAAVRVSTTRAWVDCCSFGSSMPGAVSICIQNAGPVRRN